MKDGHSKLDRLLDLRRHEEELRTAELAFARQAAAEAEEALRSLEEQRRQLEQILGDVGGESVGQVQTLRLLLEKLDQGITNALVVRQLAAATAEEKAEYFTVANRDREALERVVIPRHEHARALQRVVEQKQEDEAALVRFRSSGSGSS